jgi:hypothetical protein
MSRSFSLMLSSRSFIALGLIVLILSILYDRLFSYLYRKEKKKENTSSLHNRSLRNWDLNLIPYPKNMASIKTHRFLSSKYQDFAHLTPRLLASSSFLLLMACPFSLLIVGSNYDQHGL